jgi:serine/threonine-protein kinase ATR
MAFLRQDARNDIREANRTCVLHFLKLVKSRDTPVQIDARLHTWAAIGRICGEPELRIALTELVDVLGHPQTVICGAAYHEVGKIKRG